MQERVDSQDEPELGMAANSILQSIPPHVLKALEQQQTEANELNAESKVSLHSCVTVHKHTRTACMHDSKQHAQIPNEFVHTGHQMTACRDVYLHKVLYCIHGTKCSDDVLTLSSVLTFGNNSFW